MKTGPSSERGTEGQAGTRGEYKIKQYDPICVLIAGLIQIASLQNSLCRGRSVAEVALLSKAGA